jgi:hypothetical protein
VPSPSPSSFLLQPICETASMTVNTSLVRTLLSVTSNAGECTENLLAGIKSARNRPGTEVSLAIFKISCARVIYYNIRQLLPFRHGWSFNNGIPFYR